MPVAHSAGNATLVGRDGVIAHAGEAAERVFVAPSRTTWTRDGSLWLGQHGGGVVRLANASSRARIPAAVSGSRATPSSPV